MNLAFYPGCAFHGAAGLQESFEAVNKALGLDFVAMDDWNCCGATVAFSVDKNQALLMTARNLALAKAAGAEGLVTVCNACYTTLRKGAKILGENPAALELVNNRLATEGLEVDPAFPVRQHLEVLVRDVDELTWRSEVHNTSETKVAAYYGCQFSRPWGEHGEPDHPERPHLLDELIERLGFEAVEHSARTMCCGASHSVPHAKACSPLVGRIVRGMLAAGAEMAVTICPMCQLNVDEGQKSSSEQPLPMLYATQLVGLALGLSHEELGLGKLLTPLERRQRGE